MERTGSSMLTMMLNRNSQILSPSEEPFILYFYRAYKNKLVWSVNDIDLFITRFERVAERNLYLVYSPLEQLKTQMVQHQDHLPFDLLIRIIYSLYLPKLNKSSYTMIVDKQLKYALYPDAILQILPQSKFVILVRDFKSVAASLKKRKNYPIAYSCKIWNMYYSGLWRFNQENPTKCIFIHYEKLVKTPEIELRKICAFLGLNFEAKMLTHHLLSDSNAMPKELEEKIDPVYLKKIQDFHSNTIQPVNKELVDNWKHELTDNEIDICAQITKPIAKLYGYETKNSRGQIRLSFRNRLAISKAYFDRKIHLHLYVISPIQLKSFVKKFRPNINARVNTLLEKSN